jgi:hypothetical protein
MATERAIALIRAGAVGRLEKAASRLSEQLEGAEGLKAPLATIRGLGDIELAHARQLEALADVLDSVVKAVEGTGKTGEKEEKWQVVQVAQAKSKVDRADKGK